MDKQVVCKSCGNVFTLTEKQLQFYAGRGWNSPKTCTSCRAKKRQERLSPYYGLDEVMANYTVIKKRRQRVHYNPYIVGGFR